MSNKQYTGTKRNCEKQFAKKSNRDRHSQSCGVRNSSKPHHCVCGYKTDRKDNLKRHRTNCSRIENNEPRQYKCVHCPFQTSYKNSLTRHMVKHADTILCDTCNKQYSAAYFAKHKCGESRGAKTCASQLSESVKHNIMDQASNKPSLYRFGVIVRDNLRADQSPSSKALLQKLSTRSRVKNKYQRHRWMLKKIAEEVGVQLREADVRCNYAVPIETETYQNSSQLHQVNHLSYPQLLSTLTIAERSAISKGLIFATQTNKKKKGQRTRRGVTATTTPMTGKQYALIDSQNRSKKKKQGAPITMTPSHPSRYVITPTPEPIDTRTTDSPTPLFNYQGHDDANHNHNHNCNHNHNHNNVEDDEQMEIGCCDEDKDCEVIECSLCYKWYHWGAGGCVVVSMDVVWVEEASWLCPKCEPIYLVQ